MASKVKAKQICLLICESFIVCCSGVGGVLMNWCCINFRSWFEAAGERGFTVFAEKTSSGELVFVMQHRSVDVGQENLVQSQTPLSLVADACIAYCPWCGRNLPKWYDKDAENLYKPNLKITY